MTALQDASAGPVFQPLKDDYAKTFELGGKNSKSRKPYDTGEPAIQLLSPGARLPPTARQPGSQAAAVTNCHQQPASQPAAVTGCNQQPDSTQLLQTGTSTAGPASQPQRCSTNCDNMTQLQPAFWCYTRCSPGYRLPGLLLPHYLGHWLLAYRSAPAVCAADSAFFWAAGANTSGITGAWLDIAREVRLAAHVLPPVALLHVVLASCGPHSMQAASCLCTTCSLHTSQSTLVMCCRQCICVHCTLARTLLQFSQLGPITRHSLPWRCRRLKTAP
jgi:hypothetical protein